VTALLNDAGIEVGKDRVQRIWRREGLKVPQKQPKRSRLWLTDGSCVRLRPRHRNHVWSFDFVECQTQGLSGFLCEAGYPSCVHEALIEHDGELRLCLGPLARRAFPFRSGVVQDQI